CPEYARDESFKSSFDVRRRQDSNLRRVSPHAFQACAMATRRLLHAGFNYIRFESVPRSARSFALSNIFFSFELFKSFLASSKENHPVLEVSKPNPSGRSFDHSIRYNVTNFIIRSPKKVNI